MSLVRLPEVRHWPWRRLLIGIGVVGAVGLLWTVTTGYVPIAGTVAHSPTWWGLTTGILGSGLVGAVVASYFGAPIGAAATRCDLRWPVLAFLGLSFANDLRTTIPILTGWTAAAVDVAALALLIWALAERVRLERSVTVRTADGSAPEGETCTTCRPLLPIRSQS